MKHADELVVLLHGIGRTAFSLRPIEKALIKEGYRTLNIDYPSRKHDIPTLANIIYDKITAYPHLDSLTVHFVTHSMGSIIIRVLLAQYPMKNAQRIVMLAPPNHGSEIADFLKNNFLFKAIYGPAAQQLTTAFAKATPFPSCMLEVGIIAGNLCLEPFCYFLLPGKNDGMVTIESTKLSHMADHIVMPVTHSFLMMNNKVIKQVLAFLAQGKFAR